MGQPSRTQTAAEWWHGLPGAWRANVALYGLATLALVALVTQIVAGGGAPPQRVEVASRAPAKTTSTTARLQTTTTAGPTTTEGGPTTTGAPGTTVAPAPPPRPASPPAPPPPLSVEPAPQDTVTTPPVVCRNSSDPQCGPFSWDPAPAENQVLTAAVSASPPDPTTGEVTFTVRVTDPDHLVTDNCAEANYGDGSSIERRACTPGQCVDAHGPWTPPAQVTGSGTFTFRHRSGNYTATFTFHTDEDIPCPNPYGSVGFGSIRVTAPGP